MTDNNKTLILAEFVKLSVQYRDLWWEVQGWRGDPTTFTDSEKEHLLRVAMFADFLESAK